MKRMWLVGWLAGLLLLASVAAAQAPILTRGPYLQSTTRDSTLIVWRTDTPGSSLVEYGESGYGQVVSDTTPVTTHVITLTGLTPATTYAYRISTDGALLYTSTLTTAPDPGGALSFVVIGDSGIGSPEQYAVAGRMLALDPDFMLHTGDVIYPSGQAAGFDPYFFAPYRDLLARAPAFPSLGNHDYGTANGQPYLDAFYLPSNNPAGTERYYSFDWGDAHFVALDSTPPRYADNAMLQWLQADLAASTAAWKFVFFHHAMYTSGPHASDPTLPDMRATLAPLFEQYDVDIVFNGHDHDYERSKPQNGVIYIVSGGGGASLYPVGVSDFTAFSASVHHTVYARLDGCILSLRAVDTGGATIDQIVMAKCAFHTYLPMLLKNS